MSDNYHNDYIKYKWGTNSYKERTNKNEIFSCRFEPCTEISQSWRLECIRAADLIYQSTDKNITIHFSGGIDSEIICRSFIELGHPFKVCICRFKNGLNKHDIDYAIRFCKKFEIPFYFTELDMAEYLKTNCSHYRDIIFPNPFWQTNMYKLFLEQGSGYQIIGSGDVYLCHDILNIKKQSYKNAFHFPGAPIRPAQWNKERRLDDDIYFFMYEAYLEVSSYMENNDIDGTSLFYFYTPELLYSYLTEDLVLDWLNYCTLKDLPKNRLYPYNGFYLTSEEYKKVGHLAGGNSIARFKKNIKYKNWPEMEDRPKYTGMEYLQKEIIEFIDMVSINQPFDSYGNNVVTIPHKEILKQLKGNNNE